VLQLLHLCDSLFPLGSFAHSDGLETAAATGIVRDAASLQEWLDAALDESFARLDGPSAWQAWRLIAAERWDDLARLDAETIALRPSSSGRGATRSMGQRLLATWRNLHPGDAVHRLDDVHRLMVQGRIAPAFPVAFAAACASAGIARHASVEALAYTRLAATVSAAMRLAPVGQHEAHALLSRTLARVPAVVVAIGEADAQPESFTPAMDIASMAHQYLHSRLFRS